MQPESIAEMFRQATQHHQQGRRQPAESLYRAVLNFEPDQPFCLQQLGLLLAELGRPREAVPFLERSCRVKADVPAFWSNLGEIYRQVDRLVESQQAFHAALRLDPFFPEAHYNLANVLKILGRHGEALVHYDRAVNFRPNYDRAWYNLGNTLSEEGRSQLAVNAYLRALALRPDWADAHLNLANAYFDLRDVDSADASYRRAIELKPGDADIADSLGNCLLAAGRVNEAVMTYRKANADRPTKWPRAMRTEMLAEVVTPDLPTIDSYRANIATVLARFADRGPVPVADLHTSGVEPPMLLAYQGRVDRELREQYSQFFRERLPSVQPPAVGHGPPSVGFVVTRGHEGVFARCLGPLVARLDRKSINVRVVCTRSGANILHHMLSEPALDFVLLSDRVDASADLLRRTGFDVLVYWEIGTDSTNYFLPYFRPARVQVNCWGWPATSGHSEVESYLSADALEPTDGESHYTETLIRLRELPTFYVRPPAPTRPCGKTAFGFAADDHVYLCQQNVRKYHPEFDVALAAILRADPRGFIGIIVDEYPAITEMLRRRLNSSMPEQMDRVRFLDRLDREAYLDLVASSDVVLDTFHYGGGANTVLDTVACATPMVTWAGPLQRGRWASAVNRQLGLDRLVAETQEQYVSIATEVATTIELQRSIRATLAEQGSGLFENWAAVREWDAWLVEAVTRARR